MEATHGKETVTTKNFQLELDNYYENPPLFDTYRQAAGWLRRNKFTNVGQNWFMNKKYKKAYITKIRESVFENNIIDGNYAYKLIPDKYTTQGYCITMCGRNPISYERCHFNVVPDSK